MMQSIGRADAARPADANLKYWYFISVNTSHLFDIKLIQWETSFTIHGVTLFQTTSAFSKCADFAEVRQRYYDAENVQQLF